MADDVTDDQAGSISETSNQKPQGKKSSDKSRAPKRAKSEEAEEKNLNTEKEAESSEITQTSSEVSPSVASEEQSEKEGTPAEPEVVAGKELNLSEVAVPGPSGLSKKGKEKGASSGKGLAKKQKLSSPDSDTPTTESSASGKSKSASQRKSKKRKLRDIPFYSPKKLRSATRLTTKDRSTDNKTAKTGGRLSRATRNPLEVGGSQSSGTLGSCASSR